MNILKDGKTFVKNILTKFNRLTLLGKVLTLGLIYFILNVISQMQWVQFNVSNYILEGMGGPATEFVFFHWKDCGFCKKMMPEWQKLKQNHKGKITLKEIEKDDNMDKKYSQHDIKGYPTLLMLDKDGNKVGEFNGAQRLVKPMQDFIKKYEK
uniref:Thioredoxin domain-containing protein n=1 Tax=viral metagenome TaxID=1070528 RepID=A0A6C0C260_9ZZZZ